LYLPRYKVEERPTSLVLLRAFSSHAPYPNFTIKADKSGSSPGLLQNVLCVVGVFSPPFIAWIGRSWLVLYKETLGIDF
jgi:hypothetical protein